MSEPTDTLRNYVSTTLVLQGYAFNDAQVREIAVQFARIAAIAQTLVPPASKPPEGSELAEGLELPQASDHGTAPVFRP